MKELSDNARMVIFVVLVVVILGLFSQFYKSAVQPTQNPSTGTSQTAPAASTAPASPAAAAAKPPAISVVQSSDERRVVIESPLYHVELSNRGGVVRSWKLKNYLDDQNPPHPLDLVDPSASQQLGYPFSLILPDSQLESEANNALYEVTPSSGHSDVMLTAPAEIAFHWSDGHLDVTKKLSFAADYQLSLETSVSLDGKPVAPVGVAWRGGFGDRAVYKASQLVSVFYSSNGKLAALQYKKLGAPGNQSMAAEQPVPIEFIGIEDQFFTATFIPNGSDLTLWHWMQNHALAGGTNEPEAEMAAGTKIAAPLKMRAYVGPKDLALLSKVQPSLEVLVNFGWTGIIAKPLLFILQWLHRYIPNYGWAIVVFTLALTMALFPIRMFTSRSMRKMQAVAPEIRSIQDRYKKYSMSDPRKRKMNEEVMAVYQREGINPMGSCLPMLIQLPFLWAFYRMLSGAIELRHAPWIGWIHDLSAKDPYYVLPVAMVIASYLMMKMTPQPTTGDPTQQKMMALMPIMTGVIFVNFSSGLNLYYFMSNLVGMGQQWYLNRVMPPPNNSKFKKKKE